MAAVEKLGERRRHLRVVRRGEGFDRESRWRLLEEGLVQMRELWAGPLGPRDIPGWIGGNSPRARRLASAYEGWFPDTTSLDEMTMPPRPRAAIRRAK
mgnify:CR=1 FL=1